MARMLQRTKEGSGGGEAVGGCALLCVRCVRCYEAVRRCRRSRCLTERVAMRIAASKEDAG